MGEDFEVAVDGRLLDTTSEGGKNVANLVPRPGLGQVLTRNVIRVFIGGEIDSFMDADRARKTAEVLDTLKRQIPWVLLVAHRYPEADYYITIGNTGIGRYIGGNSTGA